MWLKVKRVDSGIEMLLNTDHIVCVSDDSAGKNAIIQMSDDTFIHTTESYDVIALAMMRHMKGEWIN